jgi:hypothetical protein
MSLHYTTTLKCDASLDFRPYVRCPEYHPVESDKTCPLWGQVLAQALERGWREIERDGLYFVCGRHFEDQRSRSHDSIRIWARVQAELE